MYVVLVSMLWEDVIKLERVQTRCTRILPRLVDLIYKERLNRLEMFSVSEGCCGVRHRSGNSQDWSV